jgi:hypothetical protein
VTELVLSRHKKIIMSKLPIRGVRASTPPNSTNSQLSYISKLYCDSIAAHKTYVVNSGSRKIEDCQNTDMNNYSEISDNSRQIAKYRKGCPTNIYFSKRDGK